MVNKCGERIAWEKEVQKRFWWKLKWNDPTKQAMDDHQSRQKKV